MSRIAKTSSLFCYDFERELRHLGIVLPPEFLSISDLIDGSKEMVDMVAVDLRRGLKNPLTGRNGMTPSQVLRSFILSRINNWDLRELRESIHNSITWRKFCEFDYHIVPKHDAFNRAFNRLTATTMKKLNELVIDMAVRLKIMDASKMRVDTTVVQTDIHFPTDATLLWDVVRVLNRLVKQLGRSFGKELIATFRNRTRSARRRMQALQRMTKRQRSEAQVRVYRELIKIATGVVEDARLVLKRTQKIRGKDMISLVEIESLREEIEKFCKLGDQVIDQTARRILCDEKVPAEEKIYSIFEPHTDMIIRGKAQTPVEFGHKTFLAECCNGLVSQYGVLDGNPADEGHVVGSLAIHIETFGSAPQVYAGDRGFYSPQNVKACEDVGVKVVSIPQRGGKKTPKREEYEKSQEFKRGQRFRAGIEGRISVLFRGRGMKRCLTHGRERFEVFVGVSVLANNLLRIADVLTKRSEMRRKAA
jgi:IS5 family transposase